LQEIAVSPEQIAADAAVVISVARQFAELQARTGTLLDGFQGSSRGYLTPTEDEAVRHLLVSYWQSRSALLELVTAFRRETDFDAQQRPRAFLVAFAAALVLIDAARFLRERFHEDRILRAKLNEPEPHFAIPAWTYETVQASLTKPLHVWHLYHALSYFQLHEGELRALSADEPFGSLLMLIDRLSTRLQIGLRSYTRMRVRVKTRLAWNALRRDLLHRALFGLQRLAGNFASEVSVRPAHCPQLPNRIVEQLRGVLRPGDVLITRKEHALTNYFLPGFWPHAALFLGDCPGLERMGVSQHHHALPRWRRLLEVDPHEPARVLEALKDGVQIRSFRSPCCCDAIAVLRPQLEESQIAEALCRGLFHEGKEYDFDFDFTRSDRLVCTEVVYRSYDGVAGMTFPLTRRAGRMTLAAEDLIQMALDQRHFRPLAVFCAEDSAELLIDEAAASLLRKKRCGS